MDKDDSGVIWIVWSTTQGPIQAFGSKADAEDLAAQLGSQWIRVNPVGLTKSAEADSDE